MATATHARAEGWCRRYVSSVHGCCVQHLRAVIQSAGIVSLRVGRRRRPKHEIAGGQLLLQIVLRARYQISMNTERERETRTCISSFFSANVTGADGAGSWDESMGECGGYIIGWGGE